MPDAQPLFLTQSVNPGTMSEAAIQREFLLTRRWIVQNEVPASGVTLTNRMRLAVETLQQLENEMFYRTQQTPVDATSSPAAQARRGRRSGFASRIQSDSRYSRIYDPACGDEPIGYYYSQRYLQTGIFFTPDHYVEAIGRVYDLEGNMVWMTEAGLAEPAFDPISIVVDVFTGGGTIELRGLVRVYTSVASSAASDAVTNDFHNARRSNYLGVRVIPRRVRTILLERARSFYQ